MDWNVIAEIAKNVVVGALIIGNVGGLIYLIVGRIRAAK